MTVIANSDYVTIKATMDIDSAINVTTSTPQKYLGLIDLV